MAYFTARTASDLPLPSATVPALVREAIMPTIEQCKEYAAECQRDSTKANTSIRRATILMAIAQSWTTLASQLAQLAIIIGAEGL
jgi:hypothetical protein